MDARDRYRAADELDDRLAPPFAGERMDEFRAPRMSMMGRDVPLPRSRILRTVIGVMLVLFGFLGFLPILGFWMIPLGLLVLANDFPAVRRFNRRAGVWARRTFRRKR